MLGAALDFCLILVRMRDPQRREWHFHAVFDANVVLTFHRLHLGKDSSLPLWTQHFFPKQFAVGVLS